MSRNFYILAAALCFFALLAAGMTFVPSSFQPGLPANGSLWRTVATSSSRSTDAASSSARTLAASAEIRSPRPNDH
jgi:hypothetical protein